MNKEMRKILLILWMLLFLLSGCGPSDNLSASRLYPEQITETSCFAIQTESENNEQVAEKNQTEYVFSLSDIPAYSGNPYTEVNGNIPCFTEADFVSEAFEEYSELDSMGRCGVAFANIGVELMPTEERGAIGDVKPTGWQIAKYDIVDGKYLYNRCHLIGFQLTGENANARNLITGTRSMNVDGMLPFENMVADYVKETNNHVLYRVTPIFEDDNLVATGVLMEAQSVEDSGDGIRFHVFVYNAQPDIVIDYKTGDNFFVAPESTETEQKQSTYILNTNSELLGN